MTQKAGVYCLKNKKNDKRYIGSSKHLTNRLLEHLNQLESHTHSNQRLQEAFDTDGLEFCIVEFVDNPEDKYAILDCEQKWIDYYDSTNPRKGYNKINSSAEIGRFMPFTKKSVKLSDSRLFRIIDAIMRSNRKTRPIWRIIRAIIGK